MESVGRKSFAVTHLKQVGKVSISSDESCVDPCDLLPNIYNLSLIMRKNVKQIPAEEPPMRFLTDTSP